MKRRQTSRTFARVAALAAAFAAFGQAGPAHAELSAADRDRVVALVQRMAAEPSVVEAVRAQNAKKVPMGEIMRVQADWKAGKSAELSRALMTNACAKRLAEMQKAERGILEVAVMDDQGARVCITNKTSNYYRGDKAKFKDAFRNGEGAVYVSKPEYDTSTQEYTTEISVPVMANGRAIGVVGIELLSRKR